MKNLLLLSAFFLCSCAILLGQSALPPLETRLQELYEQSDLPGFGVAIVSQDSILFQQGFGFSGKEQAIPYTPQTVQYIGSISKTLIGVAIMKAVDAGQIRLETPINDILPFEVVHPRFPAQSITLWHLATHTSGMVDGPEYGRSYLSAGEKIALNKKELHPHYFYRASRQQNNEEMPLAEFLSAQYVKGGKWYKKKNFLKSPPGSTYEYSNSGAALAALVLEIATGESFADYSRKHILDPVGMEHSGWSFDEIDQDAYAVPYWYDHQPYPPYRLITYPDGGLLSSVSDLALFMQEMMRGYAGEGSLLSDSAFQTLLNVQFEGGDNPGIFWDNTSSGWKGHGGGDPGTFTLMLFHPEEGIGKIFFTNIFADFDEEMKAQFREIWKTLGTYQD